MDRSTSEVAGYDTRPVSGACRPPPPPPFPVKTAHVLDGVSVEEPTGLVANGEDAWFVLERKGRIVRASRDGVGWTSSVALDLSASVESEHFEAGLLGMALSPDFATTGEAFVYFTRKGEGAVHYPLLARVRSVDGGRTFDPSTVETVLEREQELLGHYGGKLAFGPDRMLYAAVGDGMFGDPLRRAQDPSELWGKVLRLDVLGGRPYAIPEDNPFASGGGRPEVYALGFRNPWGMSIAEDGTVWLSDVGHDAWEEIDVVVKGGNYGWPIREGTHCFAEEPCDLPDAIDPVFEYPHVDGFSVTGGFVYRGRAIPDLSGRYVFADFISGRIWALEEGGPDGRRLARDLVDSALGISAFAEGADHEIYAVDHWSGGVFRLEPNEVRPEEPVTLGELGCLGERSAAAMAPGLIPYEVNAPLWSDGLDKQRFLSIPDDATIHVNDDGDWDLPPGSVVLKTFAHGGRPVETRMLTRAADRWLGYAFEWDEAGSDARLLTTGKTVDLGDRSWDIPSRAQCGACHTAAAGRTLGLETAQMNRVVRYPNGRTADQLTTFERIGLFDAPLPPDRPRFAAPDGDAPVEERARAYLHANCAGCHRPLGPGRGAFDLRATIPREDMRLLCEPVYTGGGDLDAAFVVEPGHPELSMLVARMDRRGLAQMPPLGTSQVDPLGVSLVRAWIGELPPCAH